MKQTIILLLFLYCTQFSLSQNSKSTDTIYFNEQWKSTTKNKAFYYRLLSYIKPKKIWQLKDYYIDTNTLQAIAFSKDSTENLLHGKATWFKKNGEQLDENYYANGSTITKGEFELENIKEKYNIDLTDDKELIKSKKVFITKDTIADHIFLSKASNGTRLTIEFNSELLNKHIQSYFFEEEYDLYNAEANEQAATLLFKSDKRIYNWNRKLIFNVIENKIDDEEYGEVYLLKLVNDIATVEKRLEPNKLNITKTDKDFGEVFLSEFSSFNYKEETANFTWYNILKTIQPDTDLDLEYEIEEHTFNFLESIKDNAVIELASDIYNFSTPRNYAREISKNKFVRIEGGYLEIAGFSNLTIKGKGEVLFVTEQPDLPVLVLTECKNTTLKNIEAVHAIKETYCEASVFKIESSEKVNFKNCIADGSGRYGFSIFNSENITLSNSTIQNCSEAAIQYANNKNIKLNKVKIINNTLDEIIKPDIHCNSFDSNSITINNSLIEKNSINYITKCPKDVIIKNSTIHLKKGEQFTTTDKEKLIQLKNSKLTYNE